MLNVSTIDQYYGGSHTLRGVSLAVNQGECLALLGRCLLYTSPSPRDS